MKKFAPFAACALLLAACSESSSDNGQADAAADRPSEETSSEWPTGDGSTPEEPLAADETVSIEDYDISIVETNVDATDEVLDADPDNKPPEDGQQFVMSTVEVTFTGDTTEPEFIDFGIVAADRTEFDGAFADACGIMPDALDGRNLEESDDGVTGSICQAVDKDQIDGATWRFEKSPGDGDPVFIHIQ